MHFSPEDPEIAPLTGVFRKIGQVLLQDLPKPEETTDPIQHRHWKGEERQGMSPAVHVFRRPHVEGGPEVTVELQLTEKNGARQVRFAPHEGPSAFTVTPWGTRAHNTTPQAFIAGIAFQAAMVLEEINSVQGDKPE